MCVLLFIAVCAILLLALNAPISGHNETTYISHRGTAEDNVEHEPDNDVTYDVDYMPEDAALRLSVCIDYKTAADLEKSKLVLLDGGGRGFYLGDIIIVSVRLYDGYGRAILTGGADVRTRMFMDNAAVTGRVTDHGNGTYTATFEALWVGRSTIKVKIAYTPEVIRSLYYIRKKDNAAVTGRVTDHGNGTYTATFEALWVGRSTIKVKIAYTPEVIRSLYYIRKKFPCTSDFEGIFSTPDGTNEATLCHPTKEALILSNYTNICNLTYDNSGQSWFCGKPTDKRLICEDWTGGRSKPRTDLPVTHCEWTLLKRAYQDMNDSLTVLVKNRHQKQRLGPETIVLPATPCSSYDRAALWSMKHPTGFMYGGRWYLRHCRGYDQRLLSSCLQNKQILLSGDSTIRQWFSNIVWRWNCTLLSEEWKTAKWHKRTLCANTKLNLTVQWLPHSQPFRAAEDINRYTRTSIARHLDEMGNEADAIVVIHVYSHMNAYHHSVFRSRMRRIRQSVENILKRNKYIKILIKGFHTYYSTNISLRDYLGKIYKHILYEEFEGLHSQVVFLEQKDMTDALANFEVHPTKGIVEAMVDQTLSYACD